MIILSIDWFRLFSRLDAREFILRLRDHLFLHTVLLLYTHTLLQLYTLTNADSMESIVRLKAPYWKGYSSGAGKSVQLICPIGP